MYAFMFADDCHYIDRFYKITVVDCLTILSVTHAVCMAWSDEMLVHNEFYRRGKKGFGLTVGTYRQFLEETGENHEMSQAG